MITDDRLREIEARANAATEGPWKEGRHDMVSYDGMGYGGPYKNVYTDAPGLVHEVHKPTGEPLPITVARGEGDEEECIANAIFIAHARTDIPDLVKALREAREENARMSEALSLIAANLSEDPREDAHAALSRDAGREGEL